MDISITTGGHKHDTADELAKRYLSVEKDDNKKQKIQDTIDWISSRKQP